MGCNTWNEGTPDHHPTRTREGYSWQRRTAAGGGKRQRRACCRRKASKEETQVLGAVGLLCRLLQRTQRLGHNVQCVSRSLNLNGTSIEGPQNSRHLEGWSSEQPVARTAVSFCCCSPSIHGKKTATLPDRV